MNIWIQIVGLILNLIASQALAQPAPDRVFVKDVAGIWINQSYADALKSTKMPHEAAKKNPPLVIAIRRSGNSYPIVVTSFKAAALHVVLDVEPDNKPGSYRLVLAPDNKPTTSDSVKFLYFRGIRNSEGRFDKLEMAEIFFKKGKWDTYINVGDKIGPFVNKHVLAGLYTDRQGGRWEFSAQGQAYLPKQTFYYELSLRDETAECNYIEGEDMGASDGIQRIGYAWKNGALQLFKASLDGNKVICDSTPFEILSPQ